MATNTKMGEYISAPYTPYYFEEELAEDIKLDDAQVLEKRYKERTAPPPPTPLANQPPSSSKAVRERRSVKSQTQWTRALDAVQEHFSSHVTLDGISHKLPPIIYALKLSAKHNWILYKKRECERRKRIRRKIEREKANEKNGRPSNVLMAMVDMCESCKRLYVTVNLFWGVTLCDSCYFNPGILQDIMSARMDVANQKIQITPENIVQEVVRFRNQIQNKSFFTVKGGAAPPPLSSSLAVAAEESPSSPSSSSSSYSYHTTQALPPHPPPPPPISPGGSPGNPLEKSEVAEAIVHNKDSPFEEDNLLKEEEEEDGAAAAASVAVVDDDFRFTPSPPPPPTTTTLAISQTQQEEE